MSSATRPSRSRSNTAHGYADRFNPVEEEPEPEAPRMTIPKLSKTRTRSPGPEASPPRGYPLRPSVSRTSTYDTGANSLRDDSPGSMRRLTRVTTDSSIISASRGNLRPVRQASAHANAFADDYDDDYSNGHRRDRSPPSPDRSSQSSVQSRAASWSTADLGSGKKAPPPPPPSRAKKPPPPPPPMKRSALSASEVTRY
jgi:hypothetical protein